MPTKLPAPGAMWIVFGSVLRHLEMKYPGFIREALEGVQSESNKLAVFRARPPEDRLALIQEFALAEAWLTHCEDVSCRIIGSPEVRKKGKRHG